MGIETYYSEEEQVKYRTVEDKDINDLLIELNKRVGNKYFVRSFQIPIKKRFFNSWFRSRKYQTHYSVYASLGGMACQVINFCQDHDWSINTMVRKSYIVTYLLGILCGLDRKEK